MSSQKKKFIFVHIPKTAGTSVSQKLGLFHESKRGIQDHRPIIDIEPLSINHLREQCWRRVGLYRYLRRQLGNLRRSRRRLSQAEYASYYKFAFVRNSYARAASWYKNVMRDEAMRRRIGIPEDCSFKEFITSYGSQSHLNSQLYWLIDSRGNIPMDFIGKFERLQEDFDKICEVLGIEDTRLPTKLMFKGKPYTDFYDDETKDIIAKKYAREIDMFEFKFGE